MVIRRRKARRFPRDRTFASSTFSPLRMTTTPLFSAVSGRLDISSHPISLFPWVFHRTSKLILRALGWFLVPLSASGDGSLKKRVEGVMPIATGLVRKELEGKKRFDMDAPVGPFRTNVSGPNLEISDFVLTITNMCGGGTVGWRNYGRIGRATRLEHLIE
ncbi:hypothetical protein OPV22_013430 [Ensete ventricosum]|uniref:Uncharacterized protein n=1 Tax=Ensete ventricosum TaxID=4639 RepID=A0AAV8PI79_ENSVE|nr:hypothetical protein OPV22_013430 [Ensete ventricosum]